MKRYLFYIVIISLGTLLTTPSIMASPSSLQPKVEASLITAPTKPVAPAVAPTVPPTAPVAVPAAQSAPTQPTQAVAEPQPPTDPLTIVLDAGISSSDFSYITYIVGHESGWCPTKWEGEYGGCPAFHGVSDYDGYGLCQSTPPQKMAAAGADWETNPVTQMKWCNSYAISTYGSWYGAYIHWINHHNW